MQLSATRSGSKIRKAAEIINWVLSTVFDKWTFIIIWNTKFEVRNLRFYEVLCPN
jgi:DNA-binding HxlR family transcriptional regulator